MGISKYREIHHSTRLNGPVKTLTSSDWSVTHFVIEGALPAVCMLDQSFQRYSSLSDQILYALSVAYHWGQSYNKALTSNQLVGLIQREATHALMTRMGFKWMSPRITKSPVLLDGSCFNNISKSCCECINHSATLMTLHITEYDDRFPG